MSSSQSHLKLELMKFGETVSVKGVSRIIQAKNKPFRALWLMAVVAGLCILLWQLSIIFMKYFRWPVNTVIQESDDRPLFPDLTFCNIFPAKGFEQFAEKITLRDYASVVKSVEKELPLQTFQRLTNLTESDYNDFKTYLYSKTAYISNFPIFDNNFGFEDGLIYSQRSYGWHWGEIKSDCQNVSIQLRWDPNYIMCRTLHVPDECRGKIRGVALVLYLENFPEVVQLEYHPGFIVSQATGVLLALHANGTEPDMKTANSIGPGTETNIRLSPIIRSRLPSPYGDCTSQKYIEDAADSNDEKFLYKKDLCFDVCFQQQVVDTCGCLSTAFSFTPHQKLQANKTACGNFSLLETVSFSVIKKNIANYLCSIQTELDLDDCEYKCKNECEEVKYDMTVTTAPWPHVSSQLAFSRELVENRIFKSRFDIYHMINEHFLTYGNDTETIRMLESLDLIEKNFLQLNIFFDSHHSLVLKDVPALTSDSMMGLIGGALSLWLGVTIMTLVEVIEFGCTVIHLCVRKKKMSSQSQSYEVTVVGDG